MVKIHSENSLTNLVHFDTLLIADNSLWLKDINGEDETMCKNVSTVAIWEIYVSRSNEDLAEMISNETRKSFKINFRLTNQIDF